MNTLFYYTGVLVWMFIAFIALAYIAAYCVGFWVKHINPSLFNLKFYMFGNKEWKGKYYEIWAENYSHRFGLQKYWHSMKHLRRLAYKRFISEAFKERKVNYEKLLFTNLQR